jgi:hypothetical protein
LVNNIASSRDLSHLIRDIIQDPGCLKGSF